MKIINKKKVFTGFINSKLEKRKSQLILWLAACTVGMPAIIILMCIILFFSEDYTCDSSRLFMLIEKPVIFTNKIFNNIGLEFSNSINALSFFLPYCFIGFVIGYLIIICLTLAEKNGS